MDHPSCWPELGVPSPLSSQSAFLNFLSPPAVKGFAAGTGTPTLRAWGASLPVPALGFMCDSGAWKVHEVAVCRVLAQVPGRRPAGNKSLCTASNLRAALQRRLWWRRYSQARRSARPTRQQSFRRRNLASAAVDAQVLE